MPRMALGDVASWHQFYMAAKPSHVGVDLDGLACPLHRPTSYSCQTMGHGFLIGDVLSHHAVVGAFLGDKKPPGLDIRWSVDRLDTCVTESYME
jgi:hypothetical protein